MKTLFSRAAMLLLLSASVASAGVTLGFLPPGANLTGQPGDTVIWNFQLDNNTTWWLLIDQVDYLTASPVGTFHDLFTPVAPTINPGDIVNGTSSYTISNVAPPNFPSTGTLKLNFRGWMTDAVKLSSVPKFASSTSPCGLVDVSFTVIVFSWLCFE